MNHPEDVFIHRSEILKYVSEGGIIANVTNRSIKTVAKAIVIDGQNDLGLRAG